MSCAWLQVVGILLLFLAYLISLALYSKYLVTSFLDSESHLTFPTSLDSLRHCLHVLQSIQEKAPLRVLGLFAAAYIFKQCFSIPGSVFLNLLAGALFPVYIAFPLVCFLTAIGASLCFIFSKHIFSHLFKRCLTAKIEFFRGQVEANEDNLIFYLLFIRIFPFSPNWFINIACSVIGVPMGKFFLSVLLGLMPYNYTCVQSGALLATVSSVNDILTQKTIVKMCSIATITLIPIAIKKWMLKRISVTKDKDTPSRDRKTSVGNTTLPRVLMGKKE